MGAVGDDVVGESSEAVDLEVNWRRSMSCRSRSVSDIQPPLAPFLPSPFGGSGAGRIDLVMFRPEGFFLDTEEVLRDGNEDAGVDELACEGFGMDVGLAVASGASRAGMITRLWGEVLVNACCDSRLSEEG